MERGRSEMKLGPDHCSFHNYKTEATEGDSDP